MCLRCLCRRRWEDDDDEDSEDSEVFMLRRRREERRRQKALQREEFLANVLITKTVVDAPTNDATDEETETQKEESIFPLGAEKDMSCAICLVDYESGDIISFSHNPKCQHHFHKECIVSWLKQHDACPCCRNDYLAFSDDEEEEASPDQTRARTRRNRDDDAIPDQWFDHLYGTGAFDNDTNESTFTLGTIPRGRNENLEPWEIRLERTMDRLRRQVEGQVQVAREHMRERREARRNMDSNVNSPEDTHAGDDSEGDANDDGRLERSIDLLRTQLSRVRAAAAREIAQRRQAREENQETSSHSQDSDNLQHQRREERWEDAIRVVQTRLHDIAHSNPATRLRERSTRTMQNLLRRAEASQR